MAKLPKTIKVGSSRYKISRDSGFVEEEDGDVFGLTCHKTNTVYVAPGMSNDRTANVALHEALHVIFYKAGLDMSEKQEERLVSHLTPVLLDFIRDNVTLINFLLNNTD